MKIWNKIKFNSDCLGLSVALSQSNLNLKSEYFKNNTCKLILNKAEYTCDKCSRIFDNAKNIQVHDNDMHRRVPCKSYDYKYISFGEKDFRYHEKSEHNNIN